MERPEPVRCPFPGELPRVPSRPPGPRGRTPGPPRAPVSEAGVVCWPHYVTPHGSRDGGFILFIISTAPQGAGPELLICFPAKPCGP